MIIANKIKQRGAAAAISVFILLVVITGMLTASLYSSSSSISSSTQQVGHQKALFLAESALERAKYEMDNAASCASAVVAQTSYAGGSFEIMASSDVTGGCLIEVKAINNGLVSTFTRTVLFAGAGAGSHGQFLDEFTSIANWTATISKNQGAWGRDAVENYPGSTAGSLSMIAIGTNSKATYSGDVASLLMDSGGNPLTIDTALGAVALNLSFALMTSDHTGSGSVSNPSPTLSIELFDSTGPSKLTIWNSTQNAGSINNQMTWASHAPATIDITNKVYDSIRVNFKVLAPKNENAYFYLDDISLIW